MAEYEKESGLELLINESVEIIKDGEKIPPQVPTTLSITTPILRSSALKWTAILQGGGRFLNSGQVQLPPGNGAEYPSERMRVAWFLSQFDGLRVLQ